MVIHDYICTIFLLYNVYCQYTYILILPHLAVELLVQQDVPGSNVSVDKGLTSQVRQTLSHLATELEQCDGEGWVCGLRCAIHI